MPIALIGLPPVRGRGRPYPLQITPQLVHAQGGIPLVLVEQPQRLQDALRSLAVNMYRLAVRAEHRRRGIGLALVRAGEEHLRRQGARRITALVLYEDEVASAFWENAGYPQDGETGRRVRNL
ncbi:MAG: GNAT family N-acetyltransferase [Solirubrobacteraceae bacterium]